MFVRSLFDKRGEYNVFHDYYSTLVQALYDENVTRNVFCVNVDAVIAALAHRHIMVILDNHVSRADWCCKDDDGNGLWYNAEYPEEKWLADWTDRLAL